MLEVLHDGDQNTRAKYDVFFADSISPAVRARRYVDGKKVEPPQTWTVLRLDGPDHHGSRCDALPEHRMALITSDCAPFRSSSS